MGCGKSSLLLQVAFNYEEMGQTVALFTAALDNRTGTGIIASRLGLQRPARTFDATTVFTPELVGPTVSAVLIDEAQFLQPENVRELHKLAHLHNIPVLAWGLRSDFLGNPFPGSLMLLTLADDIEETKTICRCGRKASMNARFNAQGDRVLDGPQLLIGGNDRYKAMCPRCFYQGQPLEKSVPNTDSNWQEP